jgi:replicative DNA helicase
MNALPVSEADEKAVLGAALFFPQVFGQLTLKADDFMLAPHREIWEAMGRVSRAGSVTDPLMVAAELKATGRLNRLPSGEIYLSELMVAAPTTNHRQHAERVSEFSRKRKLIAIGASIRIAAEDGQESRTSAEIVEDAMSKLTDVLGSSSTLTSFADVGGELLDEFEKRQAEYESTGVVVTGVPFGIPQLDEFTGGLQPGDLAIVAAETSGGKTALAMQAGIRLVLSGGTVLACNLEMTIKQLAERAVAHHAPVNSALLRQGQIAKEWAAITRSVQELARTKFFIEDRTFTLPEIRAKARQWRARQPEKALLIVDFAQLIRGQEKRGSTRAQEIASFAQDLKQLAKDISAPVILVSQLNRAGVKSDRPSKFDLKESGDLENAADFIILPHNRMNTGEDEVQIYLDKNRNGQKGVVNARWIGRHYRFE